MHTSFFIYYTLSSSLLFKPSPSLFSFKSSLSHFISLNFMQIMGSSLLLCISIILLLSFHITNGLKGGWQKAHATFYGGEDASGTMGTYIFLSTCVYIYLCVCVCDFVSIKGRFSICHYPSRVDVTYLVLINGLYFMFKLIIRGRVLR